MSVICTSTWREGRRREEGGRDGGGRMEGGRDGGGRREGGRGGKKQMREHLKNTRVPYFLEQRCEPLFPSWLFPPGL